MKNAILEQINAGEVSGRLFYEHTLDKYNIDCDLVAFSNARGGKLVVGVNDKTGKISALSYSEVQEITNLLSDIASAECGFSSRSYLYRIFKEKEGCSPTIWRAKIR